MIFISFPFKKSKISFSFFLISISNKKYYKIFFQHLKLCQSLCRLKTILIFAILIWKIISHNIHPFEAFIQPLQNRWPREKEREREITASWSMSLRKKGLVDWSAENRFNWWYIYLQGEMSGSLDVFVWHIRHTMEPTETRLRVSLCCWPSPRDICCVSQSFKLQDEPSGTVTGSIGMPCSWSKLTGIEEKDTQGAGAYVWSTVPHPLRVYLHPLFRVMAGFLRNSLPRISINASPSLPRFDSPRYIGNLFFQLVW